MIAVVVRADVALAGILIPGHRMLEVVDELPFDDGTERRVLTAGEARALVWSGLAQAVAADFDDVLASINGSKGG